MVRSMCEYTPFVSTNYNNAAYRNSFGLLSAQLNALSSVLPRTADTGQASPSSWLTSTTINQGYEIFQFNDALTATKPIYIRFDWSAVTSSGSFSVAVGTATNGAGTLSGVTYTAANLMGTAATVAAPRYCYASSDGSQLTFVFNVQPGSAATPDSLGAVIIERTRDADGTPNGNGYMVWRWLQGADTGTVGASTFQGATSRVYDTSVTAQPVSSFDYNAFVPNQVNAVPTVPAITGGNTISVYPCFGYAGVTPQGASKALLLAYAADVPRQSPVQVTHYGAATQWLALGGANGTTGVTGQVAVTAYSTSTAAQSTRALACPLIRWE
jgi:hypothetical protein